MTPELLAEAVSKATRAVSRILRNFPDDVEDVLQQACLKAHVHRKQFQHKAKFSTWFVTIAVNQAYMHLRSKKVGDRTTGASIDDYILASTRQNPEQKLLGAERREILARMVRRLSPTRRREVLLWINEDSGDRPSSGQRKSAFHQAKIQLRKMCGLPLPPLRNKARKEIIDLLVEIGEPIGHELLMPRPPVRRVADDAN